MLNVPFFWQPDCRLLHCAIAGYPPKSSISQNSSISLGIYPRNPWNQPLPFTISMEIDGWSSYSHIFICIYIYIHIFLIRTNHILEYPPYHPIPHAATLPLQSCCCLCIPFPTRSYYIPLYPIISHYIPIAVTCQTLMIICLIWSISRLHPHSFPSIFHVLLTCCYPTIQQYIMPFPIKFPLYHPISHYISIVSRLYIYSDCPPN